MAILIDETTRVLVQGITGREGRARTQLMTEYGTRVVAGCTPGRGGGDVLGVPVFDTVEEAIEQVGPVDVAVLFVPAPFVMGATLEAIDAGVPTLVVIPDRVPAWDVLAIQAAARAAGTRIVGPNTVGILSPERAVVGMIGGSATNARALFRRGPVGVLSRSGGMTTALAHFLNEAGVGQTTLLHVGSDAVVGTPLDEAALLFEADPETELLAIFGEIGTGQEERLAALVEAGRVTRPIVAYVGGRGAKEGTRFSHAGAIVDGHRGNHGAKVEALERVGARVVDRFEAMTKAVVELLKRA